MQLLRADWLTARTIPGMLFEGQFARGNDIQCGLPNDCGFLFSWGAQLEYTVFFFFARHVEDTGQQAHTTISDYRGGTTLPQALRRPYL